MANQTYAKFAQPIAYSTSTSISGLVAEVAQVSLPISHTPEVIIAWYSVVLIAMKPWISIAVLV